MHQREPIVKGLCRPKTFAIRPNIASICHYVNMKEDDVMSLIKLDDDLANFNGIYPNLGYSKHSLCSRLRKHSPYLHEPMRNDLHALLTR